MLGSLKSSSCSHDQQDEEEDSLDLKYNHDPYPPSRVAAAPAPAPFSNSSAIHMRQLLISCAELISQSDFSAAHRLISILSSNCSPYGDSTERLLHHFTRALSLRLNRQATGIFIRPPPPAATTSINIDVRMNLSYNFLLTESSSSTSTCTSSSSSSDEQALQSCYLSLNQITPFIRFTHLTANQAILEQVAGQQSIHIIDFDINISHGVQWPPLMQALADRSDNPPMLRITATGHDLSILHRTGDRLLKFARSLGLSFQFHPLLLLNNDPTSLALYLASAITLLPDEALAVNCVFYLHRLLKDDSSDLRLFLRKIKGLNPRVVTIAEREANHNHPQFLQRFQEALEHYAALFNSLEATLPPNSKERLAVEQIWFGREIMEIVAAEGDGRRERHERFEWWEMMVRSTGFANIPLSPFALSQAKLLLRLHYPSEGYQLQIVNNSLFLGWQNRNLFSVSSWH